MKKEIIMRMTASRAKELGFHSTTELVMAPVEIDLDKLSPAARWLAEQITATYVTDELRDRIPVVAVAGFSMKERDIKAGMPIEKVERFEKMYGEAYTSPMETWVTFPIYGHKTTLFPEDVLEGAVFTLQQNGAVKFRQYKSEGGAEYMLNI